MVIMTFHEWRAANQDLEDEVRGILHSCGVPFGELADRGDLDAWDYIDDTLRVMYRDQSYRDQCRLQAWNDLLAATGEVG